MSTSSTENPKFWMVRGGQDSVQTLLENMSKNEGSSSSTEEIIKGTQSQSEFININDIEELELDTHHDDDPNQVEVSPSDNRKYESFVLEENKMKVLVISDPDTTKCAAALSVQAGSLLDPKEIPGLAHLCQKILTASSSSPQTKYSRSNEEEEESFEKFVTSNGGQVNSFTSRDSTTFSFEIGPTHFDRALEKFAQLFIDPLLTDDDLMIEKGISAVQTEFERNLPMDQERRSRVDQFCTRMDHPFGQFDIGNTFSLWTRPQTASINLKQFLANFHANFYSANLMCLAVLGQFSCAELQILVEDVDFGSIQNKNLERPRWPASPYGVDQLKTKIELVPILNVQKLYLIFPVPNYESADVYKTGLILYMDFLLSHEGPGSLLALLREENWSYRPLKIEYNQPGLGFAFFTLDIELTNSGLKNVYNVIHHVFQYLKMVRMEGPQRWIWNEIRYLKDAQFWFLDQEPPLSYVKNLVSTSMPNYPPHHYLNGKFLMRDYKPTLLRQFMGHLTPTNLRIIVSAKNNDRIADEVEEWYRVKYKYSKIDKAHIQKWKNCLLHDDLRLPIPNQFISTSFDLKGREPTNTTGIITPRIIEDGPLAKVWFLQDNEFNSPTATIILAIQSPLPKETATNFNSTRLIEKVMKESLREIACDAKNAGLITKVDATLSGLTITTHGYDNKLAKFFDYILNSLLDFCGAGKVGPRYKDIKEEYIQQLSDWREEEPYVHAVEYIWELLNSHTWSPEQLHQAMMTDDTSPFNLMMYCQKFLAHVKLLFFFYGNLTEAEAMETYKSSLKYFELLGSQPIPPGVLKMEAQPTVLTHMHAESTTVLNAEHPTNCESCVVILLQTGQGDKDPVMDTVLTELTEILIKGPAAQWLRREEQIVWTEVRKSRGILGIQIILQDEKDPAQLENLIETFLYSMQEQIEAMSEKDLTKFRKTLIDRKSERPKTMRMRGCQIFDEILRDNNFERQSQEISELEKIRLTHVLRFFKDRIVRGGPHRKKICVQVASLVEKSDIVLLQSHSTEVNPENNEEGGSLDTNSFNIHAVTKPLGGLLLPPVNDDNDDNQKVVDPSPKIGVNQSSINDGPTVINSPIINLHNSSKKNAHNQQTTSILKKPPSSPTSNNGSDGGKWMKEDRMKKQHPSTHISFREEVDRQSPKNLSMGQAPGSGHQGVSTLIKMSPRGQKPKTITMTGSQPQPAQNLSPPPPPSSPVQKGQSSSMSSQNQSYLTSNQNPSQAGNQKNGKMVKVTPTKSPVNQKETLPLILRWPAGVGVLPPQLTKSFVLRENSIIARSLTSGNLSFTERPPLQQLQQQAAFMRRQARQFRAVTTVTTTGRWSGSGPEYQKVKENSIASLLLSKNPASLLRASIIQRQSSANWLHNYDKKLTDLENTTRPHKISIREGSQYSRNLLPKFLQQSPYSSRIRASSSKSRDFRKTNNSTISKNKKQPPVTSIEAAGGGTKDNLDFRDQNFDFDEEIKRLKNLKKYLQYKDEKKRVNNSESPLVETVGSKPEMRPGFNLQTEIKRLRDMKRILDEEILTTTSNLTGSRQPLSSGVKKYGTPKNKNTNDTITVHEVEKEIQRLKNIKKYLDGDTKELNLHNVEYTVFVVYNIKLHDDKRAKELISKFWESAKKRQQHQQPAVPAMNKINHNYYSPNIPTIPFFRTTMTNNPIGFQNQNNSSNRPIVGSNLIQKKSTHFSASANNIKIQTQTSSKGRVPSSSKLSTNTQNILRDMALIQGFSRITLNPRTSEAIVLKKPFNDTNNARFPFSSRKSDKVPPGQLINNNNLENNYYLSKKHFLDSKFHPFPPFQTRKPDNRSEANFRFNSHQNSHLVTQFTKNFTNTSNQQQQQHQIFNRSQQGPPNRTKIFTPFPSFSKKLDTKMNIFPNSQFSPIKNKKSVNFSMMTPRTTKVSQNKSLVNSNAKHFQNNPKSNLSSSSSSSSMDKKKGKRMAALSPNKFNNNNNNKKQKLRESIRETMMEESPKVAKIKLEGKVTTINLEDMRTSEDLEDHFLENPQTTETQEDQISLNFFKHTIMSSSSEGPKDEFLSDSKKEKIIAEKNFDNFESEMNNEASSSLTKSESQHSSSLDKENETTADPLLPKNKEKLMENPSQQNNFEKEEKEKLLLENPEKTKIRPLTPFQNSMGNYPSPNSVSILFASPNNTEINNGSVVSVLPNSSFVFGEQKSPLFVLQKHKNFKTFLKPKHHHQQQHVVVEKNVTTHFKPSNNFVHTSKPQPGQRSGGGAGGSTKKKRMKQKNNKKRVIDNELPGDLHLWMNQVASTEMQACIKSLAGHKTGKKDKQHHNCTIPRVPLLPVLYHPPSFLPKPSEMLTFKEMERIGHLKPTGLTQAEEEVIADSMAQAQKSAERLLTLGSPSSSKENLNDPVSTVIPTLVDAAADGQNI